MAQPRFLIRSAQQGPPKKKMLPRRFQFINPHRLFHGVWMPQLLEERPQVSEKGEEDQVRGIPLRDVLDHYGFETKPEGRMLRTRSEHHNIVVIGGRWFDNKTGVSGGGAMICLAARSRSL